MIPVGDGLRVLLVEDDPRDAELTQLAFENAGDQAHFSHVASGDEALSFLRRESPHETAPRPDLVLLDLRMPGLDGHEVLDAIKRDERTADIPVVVLTTSSAPQDVEKAYAEHAACYVVKPQDFSAFEERIALLRDFWLRVVALPGRA